MALKKHLKKMDHNHNNKNHQYDKHEGHRAELFLRKFWIVLFLTIPILIYSEIFEIIFGFQAPEFAGLNFIILGLASIILFYGGSVFIVGAYREIKSRLPGMMTLISLAISSAYIFSLFQIIQKKQHNLFWELATLITIMLLGHWLEMRAIAGASGALKELSKLLPDKAERVKSDGTESVLLSELRVGDIVLVRPGAKVPADGEITDGESDLNESMITGESKPIFKKQGDSVIAGTINGDGVFKIKISNIGEKTFLAGVMRLVNEAQESKSRLQVISDKAAFYLTFVAVVGGIITLVSWLIVGAEASFAVTRLVAVLVIACPHALGLAVPLVASISTSKAAQGGFLIKQRLALEAARNVG